MTEFPEPGEIAVCRVKKVLGYGAFVELLEYDDARGFIHISEVASRWVKNIRNYVKEGQIRAAKVISIDSHKGQIDLSLIKVPANVQGKRIEEWKRFKRNKKLIEIFADSVKEDFDKVWELVAEPLIEKNGSLQDAFEKISLQGIEFASDLPEKWRGSFVDLVEKNVVVPKKTVKGELSISNNASDGVERIKKAFKKSLDGFKKEEIEVFYAGSGKYMLSVVSFDFKNAEKILNDVSESIIKETESLGGTASFKKLE